ncbi:hypothetical protein ACNFBR_07035 [Pseudomonas sp. NY11955]|uniref:hypothetical protein n=1 Tax=Pseudomonas sp. NY11955 TaxID=3400363 RepID=UPI003A896727
MKPMKPFERFAHSGVKEDLGRLARKFASPGVVESGSSADGELTLRSQAVTAYVRKYRIKEGWRVVFWRSGGPEEKHFPVSEHEVVRLLTMNFP